jgi:hypothetical protein
MDMEEYRFKAIKKIDEEAEKEDTPLAKYIAQYMIDNILKSEQQAQAYIDNNKSLSQCDTYITSKAKDMAKAQRKSGSAVCVAVEIEHVNLWIKEFYKVEEQEQEKEQEFFISLEDFI